MDNKRSRFDLAFAEPSGARGFIDLEAAALEATANAVVITDQTGTVVWVNSAFETLTGYLISEIVGRALVC